MRSFRQNESGMTMGLVIITIVLIGVLGAGLLTFVNTDLSTVVEVNQGQRAFEGAEVGVQAAQRQLARDSQFDRYDSNATSNNQWASNSPSTACGNLGSAPGMCLNANGNFTRVTIGSTNAGAGVATPNAGATSNGYNCKYLNGTTGYTAPSNSDAVVNSSLNGTTTYKVTSEAEYSGARRKVEAVFQRGGGASGYNGFPMAMFATGNVDLGSGVQIRCMSVFSLRGSTGTNSLREGTDPSLDGPDIYFGNWYNPPWNSVARNIASQQGGTNKTSEIEAGIGFINPIWYSDTPDSNTRINVRRIDHSGSASNRNHTSTPKLANNTWAQDADPATVQPTSGSSARISFPFDPRPANQIKLTLADDPNNSLEAEARRQTKFIEPGGNDYKFDTNADYDQLQNPEDVVYIRFPSGSGKKVTYEGGDTSDRFRSCGQSFGPNNHPCPTGTLVIENGAFEGSTDYGHEGVIIVRGNAGTSPAFTVGSGFEIKGFVNVEGDMKFGTGSQVYPIAPENLPSFSTFSGLISGGGGVGAAPPLKSWRECYNGPCN